MQILLPFLAGAVWCQNSMPQGRSYSHPITYIKIEDFRTEKFWKNNFGQKTFGCFFGNFEQKTYGLRPRSHCSVFVSIRFFCIRATRSHCSVFVQKRIENPPFLCVHTDLPDNKSAAENIRFCAFTLLRFCEAHC